MRTGEALIGSLPAHLAERVLVRHGQVEAQGGFVLCWLHHALRAAWNPAIDTAVALARSLDVPVMFYQGLGGAHRFNADRHHRFILECARDLDGELGSMGHQLHFHLPTRPDAPGPLRSLAARAAMVVTELYPVPPFSGWYRGALAANDSTPWAFVDATCVVPMALSRKRYERAFEYRRHWERDYESRIGQPWPGTALDAAPFTDEPGFEPFDLDGDLADAIARCEIDHAIGPVGHTRGGTRAARERWDLFRARGLGGYANQRNDAAAPWPKGVSRLSPYLHYGCLSAHQLAADLALIPGRGPEKFLDELLIWRELAHHFCFRTRDPESLDALPTWAVETLLAHRSDPRDQQLDWESLARGRSGQDLWDLAQLSLLRQGELHNNLRMTWAKAVLDWTGGPGEALDRLVDLNHRFALDGNDPNSYGGILWSLGQFDRPFEPERPVTGTVRPRSVEAHAQRLDIDAYRHKVEPAAGGRTLRCIVVGAGLSGLVAARTLADHGHQVTVIEKGRGPGGRMSTRRMEGVGFDHGAQYFSAVDPRFRRYVDAWRAQGLVGEWHGRLARVADNRLLPEAAPASSRLVGVPGMSALCAHLARELDCHFGTRVDRVHFTDPFTVTCDDGTTHGADVMVVTAPPPQAQELVRELDLQLPELPVLSPCWAVMVRMDRRLFDEFDGVAVTSGPLAWVARQTGQPGRADSEAWVLHASEAWTREHLEEPRSVVASALVEAALALPGAAVTTVQDAVAHRWRHGLAREPLGTAALWFDEPGIALCGDWCLGPGVEDAFLSGAAAAGRILGSRRALGR